MTARKNRKVPSWLGGAGPARTVWHFARALPLVKRFANSMWISPDGKGITIGRGNMEGDWDKRARDNARYYVDTDAWRSEQEFDANGARDLDRVILNDVWVGGDAHVLEIGCGLGRLLKPVAGRVRAAAGCDVSGEMIARAEDRLRGIANIDLRKNDGATLPWPDSSFDFVYSFIVFQHIPRKDIILSYVKDALRTLKPGGVLKFQCDGRPDAQRARGGGTWLGVTFTESELRDHLEAIGLEVLTLEGGGTSLLWCIARKPGENASVRFESGALAA